MTHEEISELLTPFLGEATLQLDQIALVSDYLDLLLKWNAKVNLTAVRDAAGIVQRHFGESFFAARHLLGDPETSAIDVGSGAGFPGLPLKIWSPDLELTLIESNHKKVAFLREVVRMLRLEKVEVLSRRADEVSRQAELVTLRAVERFESVLPVAGRMVADKGQIGLMIGSAQTDLATELLPGFVWSERIPIPLSEQRVLLVGHAN